MQHNPLRYGLHYNHSFALNIRSVSKPYQVTVFELDPRPRRRVQRVHPRCKPRATSHKLFVTKHTRSTEYHIWEPTAWTELSLSEAEAESSDSDNSDSDSSVSSDSSYSSESSDSSAATDDLSIVAVAPDLDLDIAPPVPAPTRKTVIYLTDDSDSDSDGDLGF